RSGVRAVDPCAGGDRGLGRIDRPWGGLRDYSGGHLGARRGADRSGPGDARGGLPVLATRHDRIPEVLALRALARLGGAARQARIQRPGGAARREGARTRVALRRRRSRLGFLRGALQGGGPGTLAPDHRLAQQRPDLSRRRAGGLRLERMLVAAAQEVSRARAPRGSALRGGHAGGDRGDGRAPAQARQRLGAQAPVLRPRADAGLQILPLDSTSGPLPNGDYLGSWGHADRTRRELCRHSARDAEASVAYGRLMVQMAQAVKPLLGMMPPDPTSLRPGDLKGLLKLGRHLRSLGREQFHALYKLLTMSSADYLEEWFEFEPLKATKSASGIIGTFMGPRSPGSAYVLLHHYMGEIDGAFRAWGFCKGGNGTISQAIARAALEKGAEIRTEAPVRQVLLERGRAVGVVLGSGEECRAPVIVSGLDARRTYLELVDRRALPDELLEQVQR